MLGASLQENHWKEIKDSLKISYSPLKPGLDERDRESAVVAIHDHVKRREETESFLCTAEDVIGNNAVPKRIECCSTEARIPCLSGKIIVVKGNLSGR